MRTFVKTEDTGDFITHPEGTFGATLTAMAFLGRHDSTWNGEAKTRELCGLSWETSETGPDGRALAVQEVLTASMHEKAKLYSRILAICGGKEPPAGFDLRELLGKGAIITITHSHKEGKTFANVTNASPLPRGMPAPNPSVQPLFYDLDEDAHADLGKLPSRFRKLAEKALGMAPAQGSGYQTQGQHQPQQQGQQQPQQQAPQSHQQAAQQATQTYYQNQAQQRPTAAPAGPGPDDDIPF